MEDSMQGERGYERYTMTDKQEKNRKSERKGEGKRKPEIELRKGKINQK